MLNFEHRIPIIDLYVLLEVCGKDFMTCVCRINLYFSTTFIFFSLPLTV